MWLSLVNLDDTWDILRLLRSVWGAWLWPDLHKRPDHPARDQGQVTLLQCCLRESKVN